VHIHHVVPGVVLTVIGGFGAVASTGTASARPLFAIVFGIGAGLVLDEFALILHLDDVYWTEEGRKSVEAVVLTAALVGLVLSGFSPVRRQRPHRGRTPGPRGRDRERRVNFLFSLLALSKGKARTAVFGVLVPLVALVGAIRLARPGSPWAKRFYRKRRTGPGPAPPCAPTTTTAAGRARAARFRTGSAANRTRSPSGPCPAAGDAATSGDPAQPDQHPTAMIAARCSLPARFPSASPRSPSPRSPPAP
jgi:hypothetical protein